MLTIRRAPSRRAGFTLIELVIAMVLMSLVGGAIVKLLLRQQRFYNSTSDLIQTRQQIRQAAAMVPSDLRGISSIGGAYFLHSTSGGGVHSSYRRALGCGEPAR